MAKKPIPGKRRSLGLELKTFEGKSGQTYLVFRTLGKGFHVFVETEAKAAAADCGAKRQGTRIDWNLLWQQK